MPGFFKLFRIKYYYIFIHMSFLSLSFGITIVITNNNNYGCCVYLDTSAIKKVQKEHFSLFHVLLS